jgi:Phage tail tube protein, GTA-gp10
MANPRRGEIEAEIDGIKRVLCLTLGALAELEASLNAPNLSDLAERFSGGKLASKDMIAIIGAGRTNLVIGDTDDEVGTMRIEGGIEGWVRLASALLTASFGKGRAVTPNP